MNTRSSIPWLLFGTSTAGLLVFATLFFSRPAPETVRVQEYITNSIPVEVVKEVAVEVPAQIPAEYIRAKEIVESMQSAPKVDDSGVLFGIKSVEVFYTVADEVKRFVSEGEIKAKFELVLRRNGVPIEKGGTIVHLNVAGLTPGELPLLFMDSSCEVIEGHLVYRPSEFRRAAVTVWRKEQIGSVGSVNATEAITSSVEGLAEMFANDFLSANPAKKASGE